MHHWRWKMLERQWQPLPVTAKMLTLEQHIACSSRLSSRPTSSTCQRAQRYTQYLLPQYVCHMPYTLTMNLCNPALS